MRKAFALEVLRIWEKQRPCVSKKPDGVNRVPRRLADSNRQRLRI